MQWQGVPYKVCQLVAAGQNWVGSMVGWFMVLNATFYNISVISWQSVLLVEEPEDNRFPAASHSQTLSHNVVSSTPRYELGSNS
jgi:hypothetical protein